MTIHVCKVQDGVMVHIVYLYSIQMYTEKEWKFEHQIQMMIKRMMLSALGKALDSHKATQTATAMTDLVCDRCS